MSGPDDNLDRNGPDLEARLTLLVGIDSAGFRPKEDAMSQVNPIPEHHHEDALDHRVYVKGENTPVVERIVTSSFVELTPGEQPRMTRGKTFV
jgi:hypothetical protein